MDEVLVSAGYVALGMAIGWVLIKLGAALLRPRDIGRRPPRA